MAVGTLDFDALHASSDSRSKRSIGLGALRVPTLPGNAARARWFVRLVLELSGGSADVLEDVEVIASELFTNVVMHVDQEATEPGALIVLARLGTTLRLEVHDSGEPIAALTEPDSSSEHGRGLLIVGALAERWGADEAEAGKCVWAEIVAWPESPAGTEA